MIVMTNFNRARSCLLLFINKSRVRRRVDNERSYEQFCWQSRFTLKIQENRANQIVRTVAASCLLVNKYVF